MEWHNAFRYFFPVEEVADKIRRIWNVDALYEKAAQFKACHKNCPLNADQLVNGFIINCYQEGTTTHLFQDEELVKLRRKNQDYLNGKRTVDLE
jgi:hypothetical protein